MFNTFIKSFDSSTTRAGRSMLDEIMEESTVRAGVNGAVDVMESMVQKGTGVDQTLDFSINKVKGGNNIFDATKIKFSPKDTSSFNINKFMRNLGIDDIDNRYFPFPVGPMSSEPPRDPKSNEGLKA